MKGLVSDEFVRLVFVLLALQAACAPSLGLWLARTSVMAAYALADRIWMLWMFGMVGSLLWSVIFLRSHPAMVRMSLVAVLIAVVSGALLPRL